MNQQDDIPAPEPFHTEPVQFSGCGKPAVIGCLVLLLVVALGLVALMWKARDLLEFAVEEYRGVVIQSLPPDLSENERQRLNQAFEGALAAIRAGNLDPGGLQRLQRVLASPPRPGDTLDRESVLELTEALEQLAGIDATSGSTPGDAASYPSLAGEQRPVASA
ncbi:MAG: hypothetical protein OEM62_10325 [Acidobacteriota bacterium]|nr:hypothetical protein [Acidobacteriota bacterium]